MSFSKRTRLIDAARGTRTKPMKILMLGLPRTGTSSVLRALVLLGYKPYHYVPMNDNWKRDMPLWIEAIQAKFEHTTKPYGREKFDKLVGDYDVVKDWPPCLFGPELIAAYPEAKIILTNRPVDSWIKSIGSTIYADKVPHIYSYLAKLHPFYRVDLKLDALHLKHGLGEPSGLNEEKARAHYEEHYATIRALVPQSRILEFSTGSDGWQSLCKFLECPQPEGPFPHSNDSKDFSSMLDVYRSELLVALMGGAMLGSLWIWTGMRAFALYRVGDATLTSGLLLVFLVVVGSYPFIYLWEKPSAVLQKMKPVLKSSARNQNISGRSSGVAIQDRI